MSFDTASIKPVGGVYYFINTITSKRYVGSTGNLRQRLYSHLSTLRRNLAQNMYFQNAWNKYGEDCFEFFVLEECATTSEQLEREQFYIDHFRSANRLYGYNRSPIATAGLYGTESKQKFSQTVKAKYASGYINHFKGKKHSAETKKLIGDYKRGKTVEELYGDEKGKAIRQKSSQPGERNPMFGSARFGEKNPMFGAKRAWLFNPATEELISLVNPDQNAIDIYLNGGWIRGRKRGYFGNRAKSVMQLDSDGNVMATFRTVGEAAKAVGTSGSNISMYLRGGKRKSAGGYQWRLA